MNDQKPCLGVGCGRTDGTHADTCYQSEVRKEEIRRYWRERTRFYDILVKFFVDREIEHETHDSHGFYLDAWVGGRKFMVDPTPEDVPHPDRVPGLVRVRDSATHHYDNPTSLADVFMAEDGWEKHLEAILCLGVLGGTHE